MLTQSYLYLTNRKYATGLTNLDSLVEETSTFYSQSSTKRKIVIVTPNSVSLLEDSVKEVIVDKIKKFNPSINTNEALDTILEFRSVTKVDSKSYIENTDKEFLVFVDAVDLYTVYFKYIDSVLATVEDYDIDVLKHFASKVLRRDIDFSYTDFLTDDYIKGIIDDIFNTPNRFKASVNPASKSYSYDLLFFMNDHMETNTVSLPLLKEKFAIHSTKLVHEMVDHIASKTAFISPIMGIVDYLNNNGDTTYTREALVSGVWHNDNSSQALYLLNGFIQHVGTTPGLVKKLEAHDSWEYFEVYRELSKSLPLAVSFLEGGFEALNKADVRELWSEVEFLYRRRSRIPYLLWSVRPLT